jgi:hypothetical protein
MSEQDGTTRRQILTAAAGVTAVGVLGRVLADQETLVAPSRASQSGATSQESSPAGGPEIEWQRRYYTQADDPTPQEEAQLFVQSVATAPEGGFTVAGHQVYGQGTDDFVLVKTDASGTEQWHETYDGAGGRDYTRSHLRADDGGYFLVGQYRREREETPTHSGTPPSSQVARPWAVRTDADGAERWRAEPGANEEGILLDCTQLDDGTLVVVGWVESSDDQAAWLLAFDDAGEVVVDERYQTENDGPVTESERVYDDRFETAVAASGGGLLLGGAGSQGGWVTRVDADGAQQWETYLGTQRATVNDLVETGDGGIVVTGRYFDQEGDDYHTASDNGASLYLARLDATGTVLWTNTYDGGYNEWGNAVVETADGGFVAVGASKDHRTDLFAVETAADGTERWSARYPSDESYQDEGKDLVRTADGGYAIAARDPFVKLGGEYTPTATGTAGETDSPTATTTETPTEPAPPSETATGTDTATPGGSESGDDCTI